MTLAPTLEARLRVETDIRVLDVLEEGLVFRWAGQFPGDDDAEQLLRNARWPPLLRAYRLVSKPWEFYFDVKEAMQGAPDKDRWDWWIEQESHSRLEGPASAEIERLVILLEHDHPGVDGLLHVIEVLSQSDQPPFRLLDHWCHKDPDLFRAAVAQARTDPTRPTVAQALRRHAFRESSFDPVSAVKKLIADEAPRSTILAYIQDMRALTAEEAITLARCFVARAEVDSRLLGLGLLQYRRDVTKEVGLEILENALRDGTPLAIWHYAWTALHDAEGKKLLASRPSLGEVIVNRLADIFSSRDWEVSANDEWYLDQVASIVLGDDVDRRLALLQRVQSGDSSWRKSVARLATPLVANADALRVLIRHFGNSLDNGRMTIDKCARILDGAIGEQILPQYALEVARGCLTSDSQGTRRAAIILFSEMHESVDACVELVELAASPSDLQQDAEHAFRNFARPRGAYWSGIGEAPPALTDIQKILAEAASRLKTAAARARLTQMQRDISESIQEHIRGGEEVLDPR